MATRGRGRSAAHSKPRTASSERRPKAPKSIEELSTYLHSLSEENLPNYGDMFADMVLEFSWSDEDNMKSAIELIFETTIESREYTTLGAKVCQKIVMPRPTDQESKKTQRNKFRKYLMGRLQSEFTNREKTRKVSIETWLTIFSFFCEIFQYVQSVGNQPLAVLGKAILTTVEWLLNLKDVIDDEIDCICEKLKSHGKMLESVSDDRVAAIFSLLRSRVIARSTSCRSRCVILEVIEFRAMGWTDKNNELDTFYMDAIADATAEDDLS